ncbi:pentapeptide repeat-containing protein [Ancylobacter amanitiformis]|uniref:Pentapeptide repeat-containing protein n=1 Tax=Ancylobacter amanitiformis TaxID=217069 RepID=A0ABU0LXU3_9HYPH|nr:pentapeptide repeat-containing protein [Ancylobacter amanitiformis]MDQ0513526.1 hypothetical protein [Ancylobacter amanitiformis]
MGRELATPVRAVLGSETQNFGELIRLAGLDPGRHLRHADLRDVDLSDTNLAGFDFTGADLRGAHGIRVKWAPESTVLIQARLEGSLFAHRMRVHAASDIPDDKRHRQILRGDWIEQLTWIYDALKPQNAELAHNRLVATRIFDLAKSSFLKGQILAHLVRTANDKDMWLYEMMFDIINDHSSDLHLIGKTLRILIHAGWGKDERLRRAIESLLTSTDNRVVAKALEALLYVDLHPPEIRRIAARIFVDGNVYLHSTLIAAVAKRLGPGYEMIVRDPENLDVLPLDRPIPPLMLGLIVRRVRRTYRQYADDTTSSGGERDSFMTCFGEAIKTHELPAKVYRMYAELAQLGITYDFSQLTAAELEEVLANARTPRRNILSLAPLSLSLAAESVAKIEG